jgi:hypothetical protein
VAPNNWHHIAVTSDGTTVRIFFDGEEFSQTTTQWTPANYRETTSYPSVTLGSRFNDNDPYPPGYVEQVRIDNVCLYTSSFTPPTAPFEISTSEVFNGVIQWPYLDLNSLAANKMMMGFDLVGDGDVQVQFGYNQQDPSSFNDNANFTSSTSVSPVYELAIAGTVPGTPVPMPINAPAVTVILTFPGDQAWTWEAFNIYVVDQKGAGTWS